MSDATAPIVEVREDLPKATVAEKAQWEMEWKLKLRSSEVERLLELATAMAPAFRDKFDFSDEKQYEALTDMAFKSAESLLVRRNKLIQEALGLLTAEAEAKVEKAAKEAK